MIWGHEGKWSNTLIHGNARAYRARLTTDLHVSDSEPTLGLAAAIEKAIKPLFPEIAAPRLASYVSRARVALAASSPVGPSESLDWRTAARASQRREAYARFAVKRDGQPFGLLEVWRVPDLDDALQTANAPPDNDGRVVHYRAGLRVIRHNWSAAGESVALTAEGLEASNGPESLHLIAADGMENLLSALAWRAGQIVNAHCAAFGYPAFSAPPACLTRDALEKRLPNVRSTLSRARNDQARATIGFPGHSRRFAHPERSELEFTVFLDFGEEIEAAHETAAVRAKSIRR